MNGSSEGPPSQVKDSRQRNADVLVTSGVYERKQRDIDSVSKNLPAFLPASFGLLRVPYYTDEQHDHHHQSP